MDTTQRLHGIRINKSKVVHRYYPMFDRTDCGTGGLSDISANGGTPTDDAVTCKRCLRALEIEREFAHAVALAEEIERVHELALAENEAYAEEFERTHRPHWVADISGRWTQDGEQYVCDLPVRVGTFGHNGPCVDRVAGMQRHALTTTPRQRKAARRAARAQLRRQAPQTRAAARARRARRGTGRATAKTLLMAAGVPQEVAQRYASAFSRGVQAEAVPARIRTGAHRSKRIEVKRYTWCQFTARLVAFRPVARPGSVHYRDAVASFARARELVLA